MKSEEKLNHLFETLRNEKTSTSVSDVTSWIQAPAQVTVPKSTSKIIIQKNFFIMSSIVTMLIVGGLLFLPGNKESKRTPLQNNTSKEAIMDTSASIVKQANQLPLNKEFSENPFIQQLIDLGIKPLPFVEIDNGPAITQLDPIHSTQYSPRTNNQSNAGSWFSSNDSLFVDTLFSGVKSLVFKGDKCDILVSGSNRTDISMKYNYQLKAKGVFSRKKKGNCELSYVLKDSVLTIHLQRNDQNFNGISVLSESSKIEFYVPDNVDVKMDSDLGDIDANGLKNTGTLLYSSLGDISVTNCTGGIYVETALGDISIKNVTGKLNLITSMGDVSGENITFSDDCQLNSSMGDINVQLNNPISECKLHLSTNMGKVKVKRADLKTKSQNELKTVSGKFKIKMNTSMGDIIVR
jgi:hypothetical protein